MNFWHKLHDVNHLFPNVMVSVLFHKGTGFMWLNITNGETHKVHPITIMQRPASRLLLGMASWPLFYYNMYTMYLYTMKRITAKWKKERPTTDDKIFNQLSFQFMASLPNPFFFFCFLFLCPLHYNSSTSYTLQSSPFIWSCHDSKNQFDVRNKTFFYANFRQVIYLLWTPWGVVIVSTDAWKWTLRDYLNLQYML